jgi:hypothetical protein
LINPPIAVVCDCGYDFRQRLPTRAFAPGSASGASLVFALTVVAGIGLLAASISPGRIATLAASIPGICFSIPLFLGWLLALVVFTLRDLAPHPPLQAGRPRWGLRSAGVVSVVLALFWFHVPLRAAFSIYQGELRELADAVAALDHNESMKLNKQVGPYSIDRVEADKRGGVFFRTDVGPDGIGPDQMSYGFAFQPNKKGTPFGNARYEAWPLVGEWYVFAVSDDN